MNTIEGVTIQGVHQALLDDGDEQDIDLVVLGTNGRTALDRNLLGSVTENVVRLSDVPVVTVRISADSAETTSY